MKSQRRCLVSVFFRFQLAFFALSAIICPVSGAEINHTLMFGFEMMRPHFAIDNPVYDREWGNSFRFFTSRQTDYMGWYGRFTIEREVNRHFGVGFLASTSFWQTKYSMHCDGADRYSTAGDYPATFSGWYMDGGGMISFQVAHARVVPFATVPIGVNSLSVAWGGDVGTETAMYIDFGFSYGVEAQYLLSGHNGIVVGYKVRVPFSSNPHYQLEESVYGLGLDGQYNRSPQEIYLGFSFGLD